MADNNDNKWINVKEDFPRAKTPVIGHYILNDEPQVAVVVWYDWNYGGDRPVWVNVLNCKPVEVKFWIRIINRKRLPKPPTIRTRKKKNAEATKVQDSVT